MIWGRLSRWLNRSEPPADPVERVPAHRLGAPREPGQAPAITMDEVLRAYEQPPRIHEPSRLYPGPGRRHSLEDMQDAAITDDTWYGAEPVMVVHDEVHTWWAGAVTDTTPVRDDT